MDSKDHKDFSSYIRFEATGDSEVDCDPITGEYAWDIAGVVDDGDDDNDDALSCSYDGSGTFNTDELNGHESCDAGDEHDDEMKEDEEEKDDVYGTSYCEDDEMQEHYKSFVSFDSGQEFVDEMEKNRLFWEACLAS